MDFVGCTGLNESGEDGEHLWDEGKEDGSVCTALGKGSSVVKWLKRSRGLAASGGSIYAGRQEVWSQWLVLAGRGPRRRGKEQDARGKHLGFSLPGRLSFMSEARYRPENFSHCSRKAQTEQSAEWSRRWEAQALCPEHSPNLNIWMERHKREAGLPRHLETQLVKSPYIIMTKILNIYLTFLPKSGMRKFIAIISYNSQEPCEDSLSFTN